MKKLTYNLEKDMESGEIEIYSSNSKTKPPYTFEGLLNLANLHSTSALQAAHSSMTYYKFNYLNTEEERAENPRYAMVKKWEQYYETIKSNKRYKCSCGWKGKEIETQENHFGECICPDCRTTINTD
jgi:hypothetical protein